MAYRIEFRPSARREFDALPPQAQQSLRPAIDALADEPRPQGVKKLSGLEHLYRTKAGPGKRYRVLYQIHDRLLLVVVVKIGDRKEVYRGMG